MKNFERLNKNEMKMIVGGFEATIEDGGGAPDCLLYGVLKCSMDCPCTSSQDICGTDWKCTKRN